MEWGTTTSLAACGVDWNGDNKYVIFCGKPTCSTDS